MNISRGSVVPAHTASEEERMSQSTDPVQGPRDRETALSVAYLRTLGSTQEEAALAAGVDRRTVQRWEGSSWWPGVMQAACDRWLKGVVGLARHALMRALDEPDGRLALQILERVIPQLAPTERVANTGAIAKLDFASMTDEQLSRIKGGENPYVVLAQTRAVLDGAPVSDKNEILQIAPAQEDAVEG